MGILLLIVVGYIVYRVFRKGNNRFPFVKTRAQMPPLMKTDLSGMGDDIIRYAPPPDPVIGYANMPEFTVSGKKRTTNRKNTRRIHCKTEEQARTYAIEVEDLMEPLEIYPSPFEPSPHPSYDGLAVPAGATHWDAWNFFQCVSSKDTQHIPPAFMDYLTARSIPMSWLHGRNHAAEAAFANCDAKEEAALYGYAVYCSLIGKVPGNIEEEQNYPLFLNFAEAATKDAKVLKSIADRPGSDMWEPSTRTIAYQFAKEYFQK